MPKPKKPPDHYRCYQHPNLFGSLPSRDESVVEAVFALPMDDNDLVIYRQCTGRSLEPNTESNEVYTIIGRLGVSLSIRVNDRLRGLRLL